MNKGNHSLTDCQSQFPQCIILAAGASTRLRPLTDNKPKCLLKIGDKTLLEHTIDNVLAVGIKEIAIVIGYKAQMIREFVKRQFPYVRLRFILNPTYASTNNAYSLWLARRFLENRNRKIDNTLLLLDSDILFSSQLLHFLLQWEVRSLSTVADKQNLHTIDGLIAVRVAGSHDEEEVHVSVDSNNNIVMIGKEIALKEAYGESVGIELFSLAGVKKLFDILERRIRKGVGRTEFYEASFQQMIREGARISAVDVNSYPVIEIDTPDDLRIAQQQKMN